MILNPKTKEEFENDFKKVLRSDPEVFVIGSTESMPSCLSAAKESGHSVILEQHPVTSKIMNLQKLRVKYPARYEYCRNLIVRDERMKLPRSKKLERLSMPRAVCINYCC